MVLEEGKKSFRPTVQLVTPTKGVWWKNQTMALMRGVQQEAPICDKFQVKKIEVMIEY